MKKKLLQLQLQEANNCITELKHKSESDNWKLNLWEKLADSDLQLMSFNMENKTKRIELEGVSKLYNTGNTILTLYLYRKPKQNDTNTN